MDKPAPQEGDDDEDEELNEVEGDEKDGGGGGGGGVVMEDAGVVEYDVERARVEAAAARRQQIRTWLSSLRHKRVIIRYQHPQPVYLLFNPWNNSTIRTHTHTHTHTCISQLFN